MPVHLNTEVYIRKRSKNSNNVENQKNAINTEEIEKVVKELSQESYLGEFFQAFME